MVFGKFFKKSEALLSVDIGASSVKILELDTSEIRPRLLNLAVAPLPTDAVVNNSIVKPEVVCDILGSLLEENAIGDKRAVVAMPSPSVFTKRIKIAKVPLDELADNINMEASNFIPHSIDAVRLDYHVVGDAGRNQLDVLVVAVKREVVDSFLDCVAMAGLETAVADVDYFALQNMFELTHPELLEKTVALINVGSRYSSINICRRGASLFTGDMALGGRYMTDALVQELNVSFDEAEQLKKNKNSTHAQAAAARELIERNVEYVASEFNRQLSFFWSASGAEDGIDHILLCGGGALVPGLPEDLSEKTGVSCELLDPLHGIDVGTQFDKTYLKEVGPLIGIAIGMGIREPGDRVIPEGVE